MPVTTTYSTTSIQTTSADDAYPTTSISRAAGTQRSASTLSLGNGTAAVFYHDYATGEIAGRIFNGSAGVGARVTLSSGSVYFATAGSGNAEAVSSARLSNGNIVLTWASNEATKNVYYRIFDANLNPLTPATLAETTGFDSISPDVAALSGGGFVIVWNKLNGGSNFSSINFRRFDAAGNSSDLSAGVSLEAISGIMSDAPSVAGLNDGGFAIGYSKRDPGTGNTQVWRAVYNGDSSVRLAASVADNSGTINRDVDVVARADGGFSMAYADSGWTNLNTEITIANYNATGTLLQYVRGSNTIRPHEDTSAAVSPEGLILVAHSTFFSFSATFDVHFDLLSANGTQLLIESNSANYAFSQELAPAVTWLDGGRAFVVYERQAGQSPDPDAGVVGRIFTFTRTSTGDGSNDVIDWSASAMQNVMNGGDGNDTLIGGSANDELNGGNNDDILIGNDGVDFLNAGAGVDFVDGGSGDDYLSAPAGIDTLIGGAGNDYFSVYTAASGSNVDGGADFDTLLVVGAVSLGTVSGIEGLEVPSGATLTLTGAQVANGLALTTDVDGLGNIVINMSAAIAFVTKAFDFDGFSGAVTVNGTSGNDVIKLGNALNQVNTGNGSNIVQGGSLVDTIIGGTGIDKIAGNGGADILTGGAGADVFKFRNVTDSGVGAAARDIITDFVSGADRLNISRIDTNPALAGDQAFTFIGTSLYSANGTAQIRYIDLGADLLVECDVDGNGVSDMQVFLQGAGAQTLTAADFVL
jgi:RTX calcium-binding nonapeptide repeat (4 copies)